MNKADTIYKKFDKSDKSDSAKKKKKEKENLKRNCNHIGILETIKVAAITVEEQGSPTKEEQMEINKRKKRKRKKKGSRDTIC